MFTIEDRERVRDYVLQLANTDERITAGAVVGSLALSEGDRWSDLDLTFAVADETPLSTVLENWTTKIVQEFNAAHLFDLPSGTSIYRVFLIPGCLQFDLSFTPAADFGARGPKFKLLFGKAVEKPFTPQQSANEMFGYAVHHLLRARFCIERGRLWQAEYWISSARDIALSMACRRRGLLTQNGRGFDALPEDVLAHFKDTFVKIMEKEELINALNQTITALLSESEEAGALAEKVRPQLRELMEWQKLK